MRRLLAADLVRFGHRLDLRIVVALVPVILAVMFVSDFNSATTPPSFFINLEPPDPVAEAAMRAQMLDEWRQQLGPVLAGFAFPASLIKVAGNIGPVALLAIYLTAALIGGEFEWGTVRTVHLTSSRGRTLAVRVAVVVGLIGIVIALALVLAAILPFLLSFEGTALQQFATPVSDLVPAVLTRLAGALPFIAVPALMSVLARSISLSFLLVVLFFVLDLAVTGFPVWAASPTPWLPALTVSGSISRLLGATLGPGPEIVPAGVSMAALLAWGTVPILVAIARFRRMDLDQ